MTVVDYLVACKYKFDYYVAVVINQQPQRGKTMENMTEDMKKAVAVAIATEAEFFVVEEVAYEGDEKSQREAYDEWLVHNDTVASAENWREWVGAECIPLEYDDCGDYVAFDDAGADEACADYIRETLWAFNANFLASYTGLPAIVFESLQPLCEDANEAILQILGEDFEGFCSKAIAADGRGHFLAGYDGEEIEVNLYDVTGKNEYLYVYRVN